MEDNTFQVIAIIGLVVILVGIYLLFKLLLMATQTINQELQCGAVIDTIYEQCREEVNTTIRTVKGHNTELTYDRGVCIIKG